MKRTKMQHLPPEDISPQNQERAYPTHFELHASLSKIRGGEKNNPKVFVGNRVCF